jgi:hypothetical protein
MSTDPYSVLSPDVENEDDDFASTDIELMRGVLVTDTDWTAETILSQLGKGNIILNPRFQRRDAWDDERKSRFIESIMLNLPIPQLVLAEVAGSKGKYIVIDGKQRLLALQKFSGQTQPALRLKGLTVRTDLNGQTWKSIAEGEARHDDPTAFENCPIRTTIVRGYKSERALYVIFHRLNSGSVALSPQELRHVLHPGPFIDFAFDFSQDSKVFIDLLGKDGLPDFRMRDVEVLIRYFGLIFFLEDYRSDLKDFLDSTVQRLNSSWPNHQHNIKASATLCEDAISLTVNIFSQDAFSKATKNGFERRFNRAVFDIMVYYFSEPPLRSHLTPDKFESIKEAFLELCRRDEDFRRSLESTTKTLQATLNRLLTWGNALSEVLKVRSARMDRVSTLYAQKLL